MDPEYIKPQTAVDYRKRENALCRWMVYAPDTAFTNI